MSTPVTLLGRCVRDPELSYSQRGTPVARFTVVTSRRVRSPEGEWSDADTSFWSCVAFGQLAEGCAESLEKGTAVLVSGNAMQDDWQTSDGEKRRSLKVTCDDVAPSLRWASAKVTRAQRDRPAERPVSQEPREDPWSGDEPPF